MSDKRNVPEAHAHVSKETLRTKELLDEFVYEQARINVNKSSIRLNPICKQIRLEENKIRDIIEVAFNNENIKRLPQFIRDETKKEVVGIIKDFFVSDKLSDMLIKRISGEK